MIYFGRHSFGITDTGIAVLAALVLIPLIICLIVYRKH